MGGAVGWPKTIKKKCPAQDIAQKHPEHMVLSYCHQLIFFKLAATKHNKLCTQN